MSVPVEIKDGTNGVKAHVTEEHALLVTMVDRSGFKTDSGVLTRYKLLHDFLRNSSGSREMNVDGSSTSVEFYITSDIEKVKYITGTRFILKGTYFEVDTQDFRRFGLATAGSTPLTNGFDLVAYQGGLEVNVFSDTITQMGDFFNDADDYTNLKNSVGSQEDFLSFDFNFTQPIVLAPGTPDKVALTIQDDLTNIDEFRVIVRGYQEVG